MVFKLYGTYADLDIRFPTHYRICTVIAGKKIFTQLEEIVSGLIMIGNLWQQVSAFVNLSYF